MLAYHTAGESHGKYLVALIEGLPAGLSIDIPLIKSELKRRKSCAGRNKRARSEPDNFQIATGIRKGKTIGSPITILIPNKKVTIDKISPLTNLRTGHVDIPGVFKFGLKDARNIAERASARETVARTVAGSFAKMFLSKFNIQVAGYVTEIAGITLGYSDYNFKNAQQLLKKRSNYTYGLNKKSDDLVRKEISLSEKRGDTLGGTFTIVAFNTPAGLGSHNQWHLKLDSRIAAAIMSIQAVKGIEIGLGFGYRNLKGSVSNDSIEFIKKQPLSNKGGGFKRISNNAGGIEGGISNGENIIVKAVVKPIPTLYTPLKSVNIKNNKQSLSQVESADICAVSAASVVGEATISFELARAFLEKFGGDTVRETMDYYKAYRKNNLYF